MVIRLRGPAPEGAVTLPARVAHATAEADGTWRIGCAFAERITPATLDALL